MSFGLGNLKFQNNEEQSVEEPEEKVNSNSALYRALDLIEQVEEQERTDLQSFIDSKDKHKNDLQKIDEKYNEFNDEKNSSKHASFSQSTINLHAQNESANLVDLQNDADNIDFDDGDDTAQLLDNIDNPY